MAHHYGEYLSRWSGFPAKHDTPTLLDDIKSFLLTLDGNEKATALIKRIEEEVKESKKSLNDWECLKI